MATFHSDEADIGLRLLPRARPSSNLTPTCRSAREREPGMHHHGGMHGGSALGSRWCNSRSGTGDVVAAQRAMAIASRTYDEDESREREMGGVVDRDGHGELGSRWCSMTMAATTT